MLPLAGTLASSSSTRFRTTSKDTRSLSRAPRGRLDALRRAARKGKANPFQPVANRKELERDEVLVAESEEGNAIARRLQGSTECQEKRRPQMLASAFTRSCRVLPMRDSLRNPSHRISMLGSSRKYEVSTASTLASARNYCGFRCKDRSARCGDVNRSTDTVSGAAPPHDSLSFSTASNAK